MSFSSLEEYLVAFIHRRFGMIGFWAICELNQHAEEMRRKGEDT